ncbi:MAG: ACP S-malonyltransferase [Myxococcales bacterium]|nr:ACP S-malonyltransferase [Myxococcota bacterium]MDW8283818.1 ACP S-malonyltransferase [Myxococcales bacterium]
MTLKPTRSGIAFLFPGQGSQHVGMGRALCESFPYARDLFREADEALGFSLSSLCANGPEEELRRTAYTQPALLTVSVAAAEVLRRELGLVPQLCAGHSLGEYSALVCAGALRFADAVRLCHLRGRAMQEAVPEGVGAMAAVVGLPALVVEAACADASQGDLMCQTANDNGADQIVLSGHREAVERALSLCRQRGAKLCKLLPVSAPFHCRLMAPAAERLRAALATTPVGPLAVPVLANVDARPYPPEGGDAVRDRLYRQVEGTVRWRECMEALVASGIRGAVEVGPGRVLLGLLRRAAPALRAVAFAEPAQLDEVRALMGDIA